MEQLHYIIGLKTCKGIGDVIARRLLDHFDNAQSIFEADKDALENISNIPKGIYEKLKSKINWPLVEEEVRFINENKINYVVYKEPQYPFRLYETQSAPIVLFFTGNMAPVNQLPCISIVGTRNATSYGKQMTEKIVEALSRFDVCVVSGLALGIDIAAHRAAKANKLKTFGIVGHGLKTIYPSSHRSFAKSLLAEEGGIITEHLSYEIPNRENFPKRNRIIAGLSSSTIVIEAAKEGGALITANLAKEYKRKLFAVPGRLNDPYSSGCNWLIKKEIACCLTSIENLPKELGLGSHVVKNTPKANMPALTANESEIVKILHKEPKTSLDKISNETGFGVGECSGLLLGLEIKGIVRPLPGHLFELF